MRVHRKNGSGPQRAAHSARFLAVLMAVIVTALTACGGAGSDKKEESAAAEQTQEAPEKKEEKKPYTPAVHEEGKLYVGILQQADHGALNETSRGFEDQLRELMGDKVVIDHRIADGSKAGCDEIAVVLDRPTAAVIVFLLDIFAGLHNLDRSHEILCRIAERGAIVNIMGRAACI